MFWGGEGRARILTASSALEDPPPVEDCRRTTMQTAVSNAASSSLDTNWKRGCILERSLPAGKPTCMHEQNLEDKPRKVIDLSSSSIRFSLYSLAFLWDKTLFRQLAVCVSADRKLAVTSPVLQKSSCAASITIRREFCSLHGKKQSSRRRRGTRRREHREKVSTRASLLFACVCNWQGRKKRDREFVWSLTSKCECSREPIIFDDSARTRERR
jgi:hypothetical protein